MSRSADDIRRLFQSAAQVIMTPELRDGVVTGADGRKAPDYDACVAFAIECPPIDTPRSPTTRDAALPQILLRGPFKGAPTLHGVAFYAGIGFITVREVTATRYSYEITGIDGDGVEARVTFLMTARDLFFNDAQFEESRS
jgi:hypothetical protein